MDLLAPILGYFGSVAAIVLAFAMSYDAVIYAPLHSTIARHAVMAAKTAEPGPAATPNANIARLRSASATGSLRHTAAAGTTLASHEAAAKRRAALLRSTIAGRQHLHRLASRPYQQGPLALGLADGSAGEFGYNRYQ